MSKLTQEDIVAIVGPLDDFRIAEIIATGATPAELTEAFGWLTRNGEMGEALRHSLSGTVAKIYDILKRDEPEEPGRS